MVDLKKEEYRKRDLLYVVPFWLLSLIVPDAEDLYSYKRRDFRKRDLFYLELFSCSR